MNSPIWTRCRDNCASNWMSGVEEAPGLCPLGRSECILCLGRKVTGYLVIRSMDSGIPLCSLFGNLLHLGTWQNGIFLPLELVVE